MILLKEPRHLHNASPQPFSLVTSQSKAGVLPCPLSAHGQPREVCFVLCRQTMSHWGLWEGPALARHGRAFSHLMGLPIGERENEGQVLLSRHLLVAKPHCPRTW